MNIKTILTLLLAFFAYTTILEAADKVNKESVTKEPVPAGPITLGCRLSASSPKRTYRFDQSIPLLLEVENVNTDIAYFSDARLFSMYRFDIRLPDGEPSPLTLQGELESTPFGSMVYIKLARGMRDADEVPAINRLYDMTLEGEYTITVYRQIFTLGDDKQERVEVPSNQLKIKVHANPEKRDDKDKKHNSEDEVQPD